MFCLYHPARRTRGDYGRQIRSLADASRRSDRALRLRTLNIDDHPRNHALIAPQRSWMLSPAYDLTPAPLFSQDRRDLAMECGDQGRFANAGNILSQHARFLLEREEAGKIIAEMKDQVAKTWEETVRATGASQSDADAIRSAFVYNGFSYR